MEASEPKWVNHILNIIRVNSFRLGGLHIKTIFLKIHNLKNNSEFLKIIEKFITKLQINSVEGSTPHDQFYIFRLILIFISRVLIKNPLAKSFNYRWIMGSHVLKYKWNIIYFCFNNICNESCWIFISSISLINSYHHIGFQTFVSYMDPILNIEFHLDYERKQGRVV